MFRLLNRGVNCKQFRYRRQLVPMAQMRSTFAQPAEVVAYE